MINNKSDTDNERLEITGLIVCYPSPVELQGSISFSILLISLPVCFSIH